MRFLGPMPSIPITNQEHRPSPGPRSRDSSVPTNFPATEHEFEYPHSTTSGRDYPSENRGSDYPRGPNRRQDRTDPHDIRWFGLSDGEPSRPHGSRHVPRSHKYDYIPEHEYGTSSEFLQELSDSTQLKPRMAHARRRHREMPRENNRAKTQKARLAPEKPPISITTEPPAERPNSVSQVDSSHAGDPVSHSLASPNLLFEKVEDASVSRAIPTYACWSLRKKKTAQKSSRSSNAKSSWKYHDKQLLHISSEELHQEISGQRDIAIKPKDTVIHKFGSIECRRQRRAIDTLLREQNADLQRRDASLSWVIAGLHFQDKKQGFFGFRKPDTVGMILVLRTQHLPAFPQTGAAIEGDTRRERSQQGRDNRKVSQTQDSREAQEVNRDQQHTQQPEADPYPNATKMQRQKARRPAARTKYSTVFPEHVPDIESPDLPPPSHKGSRPIRAYRGGKPIFSTGHNSQAKDENPHDLHVVNGEYQNGYSYIDDEAIRVNKEMGASEPPSRSERRKYDYYPRRPVKVEVIPPSPDQTPPNTNTPPSPRPNLKANRRYSARVDEYESPTDDKTGKDYGTAQPWPFNKTLQDEPESDGGEPVFTPKKPAHSHPPPPIPAHSQVPSPIPAYRHFPPPIPPVTIFTNQPSRRDALRVSRPIPPPSSLPYTSIPPPSISYTSIAPKQGWSSPRFASLDLQIPPSLLGIGPSLLPPPAAMQEGSYESYQYGEDSTRAVERSSRATRVPHRVELGGVGYSRPPPPPPPPSEPYRRRAQRDFEVHGLQTIYPPPTSFGILSNMDNIHTSLERKTIDRDK